MDMLITQWTKHLRANGASAGTIRLYSHYVGRLTRDAGDLDALTTDDIEDWLGSHDWCRETRRAATQAIRSYYRYARRRGVTDPTTDMARIKEQRGLPRPTPDDVWRQACTQASPEVLVMLRLAAWCGLRRAEIAAAHSDWLEGDMLRVIGKGDKSRLVWCPPELRPVFRAADGWLFPGRFGGHVTPDYTGERLADAQPGPWTAHNLRHRFASSGYAATGDLAAVQEALGHSSPVTTRIYVLVPQDHVRAVGQAARAA